MALISALFTGVSGLGSNSQAMEVIGDNISNVNTVGFKSSKAMFGDILSTILSNGATNPQIGRGTQLMGVNQSFAQGALETSDNALDLAIDGSGFFIVNNGEPKNLFTRTGQFRLNDSGKVATSAGEVLQGYEVNGTTVSQSLSDVDLAGVQSAPNASTEFTLGANLNASASAEVTFNSPITLYNSVGTEIILNMNFTKLAGSNSWTFSPNPSSGTLTSATSGTLSFDTNGQLSSVNDSPVEDQTITVDFTGATPGGELMTLNWDLATSSGVSNGKLTGYAAQSNNNSFVQDGFTTGTLTGLNVDSTGIISGLFNNGQTAQLYQVAMADFLAPGGLTRAGQNLWAEASASGQPVIGTAQTGAFGAVLGSSLELSNVDLAQQFVTLIQTQQAFQAAARIINTTDDLLTETVNLVR
tara:strand:- start:1144 stop:2385 length:1242 start_codon:yes stop_codon:yes gene_type:complete